VNITSFNGDLSLRDLFQQEGVLPSKVHPTLAGSWKRSRNNGVDPFREAAPAATSFLDCDRDQILLEVARPYFEYFGKLLVVSECALALSNSQGVIMHIEGCANRTIKRLVEKHNFLVGSDWNEKKVGTCAIGTAIEEKSDILIQGVEHFSYGWHPYSCMASPVFGQNGSEIIGVVNASSYNGHLHLHSMGWVAAIARLIESDFRKRINFKRPGQTSGEKDLKYYATGNPLKKETSILGNSPGFLFALNTARRVAVTELNVLLAGETGTGKEVFARAIHQASHRSKGPFVAVNCGAIPGELVYSELFGYSEGAFTGASRKGHPGRFEQADGGTIFLDEVGDAPHEVQVGLLRVLEEKVLNRLGSTRPVPVDVRILAASSRDLPSLVEGGKFREDLYYRLAGINIRIPALRERREDIPLLAEHFLNKAAEKTGRYLGIDDGAMKVLLEYTWPGNVRELKNLMERLAVLADGESVNRESLVQWGPKGFAGGGSENPPEKDQLVSAISQAGGNMSRVAELLGVNRTTVYRRAKKFGIEI